MVFVGIVAGGYPAWYMAGFRSAQVIKGHLALTGNKPVFRNILVVFQFAISAVLIICTLVILSQRNYLLNKGTGFDPENKLVIPLTSKDSRMGTEALKTGFVSVPGVVSIGASSEIPGREYTSNGYLPDGWKEPV